MFIETQLLVEVILGMKDEALCQLSKIEVGGAGQ